MIEWKNVTDYFSEKQRYYKGTYLEICEVYGETIEISIFSSPDGLYEIYFNMNNFYGIVYAKKEEAYQIKEEMKKDLYQAYKPNETVSLDFVNTFIERYHVCLSYDTFFNFDLF